MSHPASIANICSAPDRQSPARDRSGTIIVLNSEPTSGGLGRVAARLARVAERVLGELGLSLPQYRVLSLLDDGSAAATALADHLAVSRPNITAIVDGLVERGFVERLTDPADRRRVRHSLTVGGRTALASADDAIDERFLAIADHLPLGKAKQAAAGLALWAPALDSARAAKIAAR